MRVHQLNRAGKAGSLILTAMKRKTYLLATLLALFVAGSVNAATYFLTTAGQGAAATAGNWNTGGVGGGGTAATNFTTNGDVFVISNTITGTFLNATFGSATASVTLQVESGGAIAVANPRTITIGAAGAVSTLYFKGTTVNQASGTGIITIITGSLIKTDNPAGLQGTNCSVAAATTLTISTTSDVEFSGATQTMTGVPATTIGTLTLSGSGTKTTASNLALSSLTIASGVNFTVAGTNNISNAGTSTINGTLTLSGSGTRAFTGLITVGGSGTWNNSGNTAVAINAGVTNGGTFTPGTNTYTFQTNTQSLSGAGTWGTFGTITASIGLTNNVAITATTVNAGAAITNAATGSINATTFNVTVAGTVNNGAITAGTMAITTPGTVTNNLTTNITTILSGTGAFTNAATGILDLQGAGGVITITTLTSTATGNKVLYSAAGAQTIKNTSYNQITLSGSGAKTTGFTVNGTGMLSMEGTATNGTLPTYTAGAKLQYKGTGNQAVGTEWPATNSTIVEFIIDQGASNSVTLNGNKNLSGASSSITVTTGKLDAGANTLLKTVTNGGTFSVASGATFTTANTAAVPFGTNGTFNFNTYTLNGTVEYNSASAQSVVALSYNNLNLTGGNRTLPTTGTVGVAGTLTAGAGTITTTSSTVSFNGSSAQSVPTLVGAGYNNLDITNSAGASLGASVTVGGALTLTSGDLSISANTLTLNGTATTTGTNSLIGGNTSNLSIGGSSSMGSLFFDQGSTANKTVNNLTVNSTGSVALGNNVRLRGTMTPTAGTFTSGGNLTIASEATVTGKVLAVGGGFSMVGNVDIERYVPAKGTRKWSFISSPISGVSIRTAWQDEVFITGSGTGGTACGAGVGNGGGSDRYNTNGFDVALLNTPSMYAYDQSQLSGNRWVSAANTSATLVAGKGYRLNIRGARGAADANCSSQLTSGSGSTVATLVSTGAFTSGNVSADVQGGTNGYTLLGNPYACEIDWDNAAWAALRATNNVTDNYWTYCPSNPSSTYTTYNGGILTNGCTISNGRYIASGQAFFVEKTTGGTATVGNFFQEAFKTSNTELGVYRTNITWTSRIRMGFKESNGDHIDEVVIRYANDPAITTAVNPYDAISFNSGTYIAALKGTTGYAIQSRPLGFVNDTVSIKVASSVTGNYKFTFTEFENFVEAAEIILLDVYMGTQQNVKTNPLYSFDVTSDVASQGSGRFKLVFRSSIALPLSSLTINASLRSNGVEVMWLVHAEQDITKYLVERSDNGRDFYSIGTVTANGSGLASVNYSFNDIQSLKGVTYYRVKSIDNRGAGKYSVVVKVKPGKSEAAVSIYPNPVNDKLNLIITNGDSYSKATAYVRNAQGRTIMQQVLNTVNGNASVDVSKLAAGLYFITIINAQGETLIEKFVKN
jgi:hypothetical protein